MWAPEGEGLGDLYPELAAAAQSCVQYPLFPVHRFRTHSNESVLWTCDCGATTQQKVQNVTRKGAVVCSDCRPAGKARWEFEVAELLRRMLHVVVETHHGRTRKDEVDLYLPAPIDMAFELDPWGTHRSNTAADIAGLERKQGIYASITRVREAGLDFIGGSLTVPRRSPSLVWAETIAEHVRPDGWCVLDPEETLDALRSGAVAWLQVQKTPPSEPLSNFPVLATEFIENLDVPGRRPEWVSRGSGDLCRWRCSAGHIHDTPVYHRTGPQKVGCPECGAMRAGAARRKPKNGRSAADIHIALIPEFIANLARPEATMAEMRPRSHDPCMWRCMTCRGEWVTTLHNRSASMTSGGCKSCNLRVAWRERRTRRSGFLWDTHQRARAAMTSFVEAHGHARVPYDSVWDGVELGEWVKRWRARYKVPFSAGGLHPEVQAWLDGLPGWDAAPRSSRWTARYEALLAVAIPGESIDLAIASCKDPTLSRFVIKCRSQYRQGIRRDREALLEVIPGWSWVGPGRGNRASDLLPDKRRLRGKTST
jgi:Probable Zinc-ribbon domain/Helicase associated domain